MVALEAKARSSNARKHTKYLSAAILDGYLPTVAAIFVYGLVLLATRTRDGEAASAPLPMA